MKPEAIKPPWLIETIIQETGRFFGVSRKELVSHSRLSDLVIPRHVAMYLARRHTNESLPTIGACFRGRDHTTILYAVRKIARWGSVNRRDVGAAIVAIERAVRQRQWERAA